MNSGLRFGSVVVVVLAGLALACGGDGGPGDVTDPGNTGEVRATVTRDGSPASGVVVRLFAAGGSTSQSSQTTGSDGTATFRPLSPGSYEVEVEVPSGDELTGGAARRPVTVTAGGTATVTFALMAVVSGPVVEVLVGANLQFSPAELTIEPGTTVRWRNESAMVHTITPQGHSEWTEGSVSTAGAVFTHTFNTAGTFPYYCVPHLSAGMTGVVTVQ